MNIRAQFFHRAIDHLSFTFTPNIVPKYNSVLSLLNFEVSKLALNVTSVTVELTILYFPRREFNNYIIERLVTLVFDFIVRNKYN